MKIVNIENNGGVNARTDGLLLLPHLFARYRSFLYAP
jgi:hypothetical protein